MREETMKIRAWWLQHPHLKYLPIEKAMGVSNGTLQKFMVGTRGLKAKHLKDLVKELKKYGYE